uniref:Cytochrome b6-f complex subunit 5 n=1 Tax=Cyanidium caldarium TaxID=2771 RepID=PETG_CYACA|nr:cytochrome b6/f complex subunit V [Cyanidium caldarium]Q9TLQ9.1 RecName: Full=Cytochrome b6-f complex subunit 5; AltName: Full=Cytochrome b6-f complex subunit PetG; AltName: Full=Cytochrome b6-f complex subunit V [Cyanidium caldarium]AAF12884.1 unknown [Cyanidium caldarium]WDB00142.1 cytochrome b6/f complex subunit V [Cyanidium caldarium]
MVEVLLTGIVLGSIFITLLGLLAAAKLQYNRKKTN